MMFGGILNVLLDPVLIFGADMGFMGAAAATALSNTASALFFVLIFHNIKEKSFISIHFKHFSIKFLQQVFSVGISSALTLGLANLSNMVIVKLASSYGDTVVAAYGIVKKIDALSFSISLGLCQGFMPLVGYNYSSGNFKRMRQVSVFSWKTALILSVGFVICYFSCAPWILQLFIREIQTVNLGIGFLRIACLAVPFTAVNALIIYTLQAMGKGIQSSILTSCRQGVLNVPLLFFMNNFIGLYGMIWTQFVVEILMLPVTLSMYMVTYRRLISKK